LFESLAGRLDQVWKRLRGRGALSEHDVDEALREVRLALLEADVNFKVVRDFLAKVRERAIGDEVKKSLTPGQQVVKIVHDELTALMGGAGARIAQAPEPPTVILLCGLQGSGKTTTAAKLGAWLQRQGRRPLLVAADLQRPAAVEQLRTLGRQAGLPVLGPEAGGGESPPDVAARALAEADRTAATHVIVDTAGRLHIDPDLMEEVRQVRQRCHAHEVLLVVDAMTGQDAVNVARGFSEGLGIDGIVLTKLDGDARGGAALSARAVTGKPIKFVTTGERLDALEPFHPERIASRILGMGDVLSLIERATAEVDAGAAQRMQERLRKQIFGLDDFLQQMQQVRRMGPLEQILGMLPGGRAMKALKNTQFDEKELGRVEAIIHSMTRDERRRPEIIDASRKRRIAAGSGTRVQDVNRLLRQFEDIRKLLKGMVNARGRMPALPGAPLPPFGRRR
jgi:signal recognition particle subunit SRP54